MNQQIVTFDGRRFLVETFDRQVVTELLGNQRGAEVTGLIAAEAIALAEEIQANRSLLEWPQTDIAAALTMRFQLATEMADPLIPVVMAFAVQQFLRDPTLAEELDREQAKGEAA